MLLFDSVGALLMITAFPFSVKHRASKKKLCKNLTTCLKEMLVFNGSGPPFHDDSISFQSEASGLPEAILKGFQTILEEDAMIQ